MSKTFAQKEKLLKAIEQAKNPGKCNYFFDGKACCVVGQLAALEGVHPSTLSKWDNFQLWNITKQDHNEVEVPTGTSVGDIFIQFAPDELKLYDLTLLQKLQTAWDNEGNVISDETEKDSLKARMKEIVNEAYNDVHS